ncbi:MAG: SUMF1/EgtB/PvdO family nonheme iron enzyme [Verrucomicrobiaceae bacterium]|nr:SUMF1/EgtB/PvdO family nonheme iron enzyme [Verrucomicrobiaceae bacterium]
MPDDPAPKTPTQQMRDLLLTPSTTPERKAAWVPPTVEAVQAMLPGYTVEKFIARGGMGAVYRGTQTSLGRVVAIKILPPELQIADENFAQRFKQEARAMGQLNHPGIVAVYDSGEMPDGTLYFVMEFVEGTDVAQMVAIEGRLHSEHAMAICAHVCDALQYAHEHGVIHRDIKPANIMVGYDGRVKVADFGLAKTSVAGETGLTRSGMVMGTLHFMAPEALTLGSAVDHRADIYAVGVMLYQMLTGKLPQGMFEMPSLQVPGLDPRYDAIITKALRDSREQRYQQISEMRLALDGILTAPVAKVQAQPADAAAPPPAALPTQARPQRSPHQPFRPPQPQVVVKYEKKTSALVWLLVLALGATAAWMFWDHAKTKDDATTAAAPAPATTPPTIAGGESSTATIKIDDAFMKANVLGTSWRTHYTNDSRYDTLEFKSTGNEVVKFASVGGQQQATWSIEEGGAALKVTTLDTSGFYFLINFTSANTADVQFIKVKTVSMVGILSRIAIARPQPVPAPSSANAPASSATTEAPFTNSLGMKFVPVPGTRILMCIHETRKADYAPFAKDHPVGNLWASQKVEVKGTAQIVIPSDDHPVVHVSWADADAYCAWLSAKEGRVYRLPTDREWSTAIGIADRESATASPADLSMKLANVFPWGSSMPPPTRFENYADTSVIGKASDVTPMTNYTDGWAHTAPVMTFAPNALGIHDLAGNVREWCGDWIDSAHKERVVRGACWKCGTPEWLLSSRRISAIASAHYSNYGFRVVVETASLQTKEANTAVAPPSATVTTATTKEAPFTNTLGMKFVPVPGTEVLFCIHETRQIDFAAFAAETPSLDPAWKTPKAYNGFKLPTEGDHPVSNILFDEAKGFCEWLSKKDGKTYRLPTDREWSWAVGIAKDEDEKATPESLNEKLTGRYPWGDYWPPVAGDGNYRDAAFKTGFKGPTMGAIDSLNDGYPATAPVMSFKPNPLGIYDLGGNISELVTNSGVWYLRGDAWFGGVMSNLLSSHRNYPQVRDNERRGGSTGFRCVVELASLQTKETKTSTSPTPSSQPPNAASTSAPTSSAPPNTTAKVTDLMPLIDPAKQSVRGTWRMTPEGLLLEKGSGFLSLSMPLQLPPEYDFEIEFSLQTENIGDVHQLFTAEGRTIDWTMQTQAQFTNPVYGFINLDNYGHDTEATIRLKGGHLVKGTRYRSIVQVRKGALTGLLNKQTVKDWKGDVARFPMRAKNWKEGDNLGLGATGSAIVFHKAVIRPFPYQSSTASANTTWTDTKGRSITAAYKGTNGDKVLLEIAGKVTPVAMNTLSPESQKLAQEYQRQAGPAADTASGAPAPSQIPADALSFGKSRYAWFSGAITWKEAKEKAEALGGHLATITSAAEDNWVVSQFQTRIAPGKTFWIGGIQEKPNLPWAWVSGEKFDFTQWAASEPNNAKATGPKATPPYMLAYYSRPGTRMGWNDISESDPQWRDFTQGYLVEWDAPTASAGKSTPEPVAARSTREAAEWVLSRGGVLEISENGKTRVISKSADLPTDDLKVTTIRLDARNNASIKDADLSKLTAFTDLRILKLPAQPISDNALKHLASMPELEALDLNWCPNLTGASLQHLTGLAKLRNLSLRSMPKMGDAAMDHLGALQDLEVLDLTNVEITQKGLKKLDRISRLKELTLEGNKAVSDAGMANIATLATLETLRLNNTQLTDSGLKTLQGMKTLRSLHLAGTRVTDSGVAALQAANPALKITR